MAMSRDDLRRLVRALEEDPEARAEVRRLILTDELLEVPARVARLEERVARLEERVAEMDARLTARLDQLAAGLHELTGRFDQLTARFEELTRRFEELTRRFEELTRRFEELTRRFEELTARVEGLALAMDQMSGRVGDMAGQLYEIQYHRWAAGRLMALPLRRLRLLEGDRRWGLLDDAVDEGRISQAEAAEFQQTDLVVSGRFPDGTRGYAVVEVSMGIGDGDADRAVERAAILSQLTGLQVLPVVAGERVAVSGLRPEVWVVLDGRTWPPGDERTFRS